MNGDDQDIRLALQRQVQAYQPDGDRIRRRFEAGIAQTSGPGRSRARSASATSPHWLRSARTRLVMARLAPVAVAFAIAAIAWQGAAVLGRDQGSLLVEAGGGATRSPGQVGTAAVVGPAATPDGSESTGPAGAIGTATGVAPNNQTGTPPPLTPTPGTTSTTAPVTSAPPTSSPPSLTSQPTAPGSPMCNQGDAIVLAPYYISNNLWGAANGSGRQCVDAASSTGPGIAWSTIWSWSGGPGQVKSYSSVVLGWHWGWQLQGTGLPIKVADKRPIATSWDFAVAPDSGTFHVEYDMWFHDINNPTWSDSPTAEVRVIVYESRERKPDFTAPRVTIGGATWEIEVTRTTCDVISFYRIGSTSSVDLDLAPFIEVAARSTKLTYLSSIEAGVNVIDGSGRLDTTSYSVTLS